MSRVRRPGHHERGRNGLRGLCLGHRRTAYRSRAGVAGVRRRECEQTGAPLTAARHDRGLSTEIGRGTDAKGNKISGQKRRRLARMRREQTRGRWRSKAERNLAHGLGEVRRLASSLELADSVRDQACQLFRSAQNEDLCRGRSIEAIAVASIYGACRCNGHSRLLDAVGQLNTDQSSVAKG